MSESPKRKYTTDDFQIGMTVVCAVDAPDGKNALKVGHMGVVARIRSASSRGIGVAWDKSCGGHDLGGACEHGHGWWCRPDELTPVIVMDTAIDDEDLPDLDDLIGG